MAIKYKFRISNEIKEWGIYYADFTIQFQSYKVAQKLVFARYSIQQNIDNFFKHNTFASIGVKEKSNTEQIIHIIVEPITYLGEVSKQVQEWKTSMENTTNNSTT